jgi:hypothetical protein
VENHERFEGVGPDHSRLGRAERRKGENLISHARPLSPATIVLRPRLGVAPLWSRPPCPTTPSRLACPAPAAGKPLPQGRPFSGGLCPPYIPAKPPAPEAGWSAEQSASGATTLSSRRGTPLELSTVPRRKAGPRLTLSMLRLCTFGEQTTLPNHSIAAGRRESPGSHLRRHPRSHASSFFRPSTIRLGTGLESSVR